MEELCTYKILNGFDLIRTFDRYVVSIMKPRKVNHKSYVGPLCPHLTQPYKFIFWHHLKQLRLQRSVFMGVFKQTHAP